MYRVTVENKETYFVVMENIFGRLKIHKKYDLKGSTVDRQAKTKDKDKEKDKEKSHRKVKCMCGGCRDSGAILHPVNTYFALQ